MTFQVISGRRPSRFKDTDKIRIRKYYKYPDSSVYLVSDIADWSDIISIEVVETPPIETRLRAYLEELKTTRITPEEVREICSVKASREFKAGWIRGDYDTSYMAAHVRRVHALVIAKAIRQIEALLGEPASDAVKPDYSFWLGETATEESEK